MSGIHAPGSGPAGETCGSCHFHNGYLCNLQREAFCGAMYAGFKLPKESPACMSWRAENDFYAGLDLWDEISDDGIANGRELRAFA